ncbi:FAD assembly factor SdhE [BD1-7 clade bacterium]|uniref:FAD assembly factor SdhE n=1 Tax=BD1-7 clade bacterium TaxID=2029982 RepID=A0A5S9P9Z4_9GAMM|nr:FAD assembly factor SdhE [BD1-7 clade bacterium]CAA0100404.1 FAD assembly factor SdhE [BD1-7 clade bacterium]CAA0116045.1 FAD assembly factor SdhE [BD1-7 clade bacterium]
MHMSDNDNSRVYWHSRRGMLEVDLALMPYAKEVYPSMSDEDKAIYRRLLEEEDTQLFAWVLDREKPEDPELAKMMGHILEYTRTPKG